MSKEEIINAGIEYTLTHNPVVFGGNKFSEEMRRLNRNKAFEDGAKWSENITRKEVIDAAYAIFCDCMDDAVLSDVIDPINANSHKALFLKLLNQGIKTN